MMRERKIGCLPVVEGNRLVGVITEGDFVHLIADANR
jgi:CBS domain-containing protein